MRSLKKSPMKPRHNPSHTSQVFRANDYAHELRFKGTSTGVFYELAIPVRVDDGSSDVTGWETNIDELPVAQGVFVLDAESDDTRGAFDGKNVKCGTALEEENEPFFVWRVSPMRLGKLIPAGYEARRFMRFALEATGRWDDLHYELG